MYLFAGIREEANGGSGERIEGPPTLEVLYSFDATDPRELAGYSDAVFVGRTLEMTGEEPLESSIPGRSQPQTQFEVEVVELISGDGLAVGERITVNQIGGVHSGTGETYVVSGVVGEGSHLDTLLEPGKEYLLAVKRNEATGLYDISAQPHGDVPLSGASPGERRRIISTFEVAAGTS